MTELTREPSSKTIRCSICGTRVRDGDPISTCTECSQAYHEACWTEIDGCATYGCKNAAVAEKPAPPKVVGGGWGDEKSCPECGASIASSLLVCKCGARFPWADPITRDEYVAWRRTERDVASARKILVGLFVATLTGFPAPLTGPAALLYAYRKRRDLAGANGVYLAIAYGSAALGVAYVGAMLVLAFAIG